MRYFVFVDGHIVVDADSKESAAEHVDQLLARAGIVDRLVDVYLEEELEDEED